MINRRDCLRALGLAASSLVLSGGFSLPGKAAEKTNFIFLLIDDMGWRDLGCYGSSFYETPNIDRLASEGMRFTDAYAACPVCSPTRASIMTGKYPARLNITDWIPGRQARRVDPSEKLIGPAFEQQLPLNEKTIAETLNEAGYAAGFVGKWHLGSENYLPEDQGFEVNVGGIHLGYPPGGFFSPYQNPKLKDGPDGENLTDRLTDEAVLFLEANSDRPFFLFMSYYAVHNPMQAKPDLVAKYERKARNLDPSTEPRFLPEGRHTNRQVQDHPVYAAMVETVDSNVGRILSRIDELGKSHNTVIFFISDNGGLSTAEGTPTSNLPLRAGKGWLYEGGIRVPMIIRAPGLTKPGSECRVPVTTTDFYPTMLEAAGMALAPEQHPDGKSLVPVLEGGSPPEREALFWHYPHYSNQGGTPGGAVRRGDYKLIEFYEDNRVELYNLREDIGETVDLAGRMPEKARELREMLQQWRQSVQARMPVANPNYDPSAE
jgi:arylsulfatase A-like enzyme